MYVYIYIYIYDPAAQGKSDESPQSELQVDAQEACEDMNRLFDHSTYLVFMINDNNDNGYNIININMNISYNSVS